MSRTRTLPNAPGPFYVESDCCTSCGVPDVTAPELFGDDGKLGCFVKKQPSNATELDRMLLTMITAELGCIRYAGTEPEIRRRLAEQGEIALCDIPPDENVAPLKFDHVGIATGNSAPTLDALIVDFTKFILRQRANYRLRVTSRTLLRCELGISWWQEVYHPLIIRKSDAPEYDWLVIGLPFVVYDWLVADPMRFSFGFFSAADWNGPRADRRRIPW
jgi:hypothetical protein